MKKVLCVAECCCDMVFGGLPRLPGPGEEFYGDDFAVCPGGGANTPLDLARLGGEVSLITGVGADDMGRQILRELRESGVTVLGRLEQPGTRTAVSAVLSTSGDRGFASYGGTGGPFFTMEELERAIRDADIVHTYLGYCLCYPIAELCERYRKELSLDASWSAEPCSPEELRVLQRCTWLKVNELEAARLAGTGDPEAALKKLASMVQGGAVVTLGSAGSIGMERNGPILRQEPLFFGAFRDACGAGDGYAAGMLRGLSAGKNLGESMALGAAAAGQCVTWLGGSSKALKCTI